MIGVHERNQGTSRWETRSRVPVKVEPVIASGTKELLEKLHSPENDYQVTTDCWRCDETLRLADLDYTWPIGPYGFVLNGIPGYHCAPCDETYFPENVLEQTANLIEAELQRLNPQPPFINPNRIQAA